MNGLLVGTLFIFAFHSFYITNYNTNNIYIYGQASDRFSSSTTSDISTLVNTGDSHFRLIDMPLNITVLEEKNNRTDNGILNSTENYQLTSDTTRKVEEFKAGFIKTVNPIRDIARIRQAHLSFASIGKIIRTINSDDTNSDNCCSKSKSTKALYLFKTGKKPIDVAIELDISASEVEELQQEFWALNQLHELAFLFNEIKHYSPSFIKLFNLLKRNKLLGKERISKFLRCADLDLPF
jgi:hypothetical protein